MEVEGVDLDSIHRVAQQFEAAVAQQSKAVVAKTAPIKTVTDRQQVQCSYCQLKGHNATTCYKKQHAESHRQTNANSNTHTPTTSQNTSSKFNNSSTNSSNHSTVTRSSTPIPTTSTTNNNYRNYTCYNCGKTGHRSRECPNRK